MHAFISEEILAEKRSLRYFSQSACRCTIASLAAPEKPIMGEYRQGDNVFVMVARDEYLQAVLIVPVPVGPWLRPWGVGQRHLRHVCGADTPAKAMILPGVSRQRLPSFVRRSNDVRIGQPVN